MDSHCFKLHRSNLISFNLSNVGEFRKRKFLCCAHLATPKFHVAVVQQRLWNVQKSVMHLQSCVFCQSKPTVFFLLLAVTVAKTLHCCTCDPEICYHGNVTSHFSSLFYLDWVLLGALISWPYVHRVRRRKIEFILYFCMTHILFPSQNLRYQLTNRKNFYF